jgi:hypothetical protein
MQTTGGLLTYLSHRLGSVGLSILILLAMALAVAAGLTVLTVSDLLAAGADPVQVSPVRWLRRC